MWRFKDMRRLGACSGEEFRLLLEAVLWLGLLRAAVLLLPFQRIIRLLGLQAGAGSAATDPGAAVVAARLGWAVRAAAARTPWESACLVQALAGLVMLYRRDLPGTLYLGVAKGLEAPDRVAAHAWLRYGSVILTGGGGHERFSVISVFFV